MTRAAWFACLLCCGPALAQVTHPQPGLTLVKAPTAALVVADLCSPGVSVRATEYAERQATPSGWAQKAGVDVEAAVNADFFDFPGWTLVNGRARGGGLDWPVGKQFFEVRSYWQFGPGLAGLQPNAAVTPAAPPAVTEIVGGHNVLISGGVSQGPGFDGDGVITTAHRRTAVGMSANRRFLFLFVSDVALDGVGVVTQMTALAAQSGAPPIDVATNMDGGGSSQMYVKGVGAIFPTGREVNNHLGVRAKGTGPMPNCPSATCGNACTPSQLNKVGLAASASGFGYFITSNAGSISAAGNVVLHGSLLGVPLNKPIVGIAATPTGKGYWLVAADGGVFTFGDAPFKGSLGGMTLNAPIVGIAATPDGQGYWLAAADGGVFAFGTAGFHGSAGGTPLSKPIVGIARTADGKGYWLVAADGGIFSYGNAAFFGSTGSMTLAQPIVGMAATPASDGYWLVAADGGIFSFGAAAFHGSAAGTATSPVVAMAATHDGKGYWLLAKDGAIYSFGNAVYLGGAQSGLGCNGNTPITCVAQPSGCYAWSNQTACATGQVCRNGRCEASCTDDCAAGQQRCSGANVESCGNVDADPCLDWTAAVACGAGKTCTQNACASSSCTDVCADGTGRCVNGGAQSCVSSVDGGCNAWSATTACAAGEQCSQGSCVSGAMDPDGGDLPPSDAGAPGDDAGTADDAGEHASDGGDSTPAPSRGCGCGTVELAPMLFALVLGVRRRRASH